MQDGSMSSATEVPFVVRCVYGAFAERLAIAERTDEGLECVIDTGTKIRGVKESHVSIVCSVDDMVSLIEVWKTNNPVSLTQFEATRLL